MSAPVASTQLYRLRELAIAQAFRMLEDRPAQDKEGNVVMLYGHVLMLPPSPAALNVIRQLLKDNGVDREPIEATPGRLALTTLIPDDDQEPTLLE